jgi:hypothetical protein
MKLHYKVSNAGLKIETFPKGLLDVKTTIEYFDKLSSDCRINENAVEVVYFNHDTIFQFSSKECWQITKYFQKPKINKKLHATSFVCETDLEFGVGRMLQAYHEMKNPNHKVFVVRSITELKNTIKKCKIDHKN